MEVLLVDPSLEEIMGSIIKFFGISILLLALCVPFAVAKPEDLVGKTAPQFALKNIMTGDTVSLEALRGKVVVLDFWATWCGPCKEAIPHIAEVYRIYKDQGFVAISIDLREDEDTVRKFAQSNQMTWAIVIDRDGGVANKYDVTAIPTLFVVDQGGTVRYAHVGFFPELKDELSRKVNELLKEKPESITCLVSPPTITMGETILLSGTVTPNRSVPVTLKITRPDGTSYTVSVTSGADGSYSHRFTPDRAGVWSVFASSGKAVSSTVTFNVTERVESITCIVSSSAVTEGENVLLSGKITPSRSTSVTLKIVRPDGTWYTVNLVTGADGSYSHGLNPDRVGVWSASATVGSTVSPTVNFEVKGKATTWILTLVLVVILAGAAVVPAVVLLVKRTRPPTAAKRILRL